MPKASKTREVMRGAGQMTVASRRECILGQVGEVTWPSGMTNRGFGRPEASAARC